MVGYGLAADTAAAGQYVDDAVRDPGHVRKLCEFDRRQWRHLKEKDVL